MVNNRRIAIIGSGISGAAAAWLLREHADVTLFEANETFGGHTHTAQFDDEFGHVQVDTGFMVFNRANYPLLCALFDHLGIASYPTVMSFSASLEGGQLEYAGSDLNGLFGQRRNLFSPSFWQVLSDILRFNRSARDAMAAPPEASQTLDGFLDEAGLGQAFRQKYLFPMAAAIWSCPRREIGRFPARSFLRFFANHGLVQLRDRPQWLTVEGGASAYMERLIADLGPRARAAAPVISVRRSGGKAVLGFAGGHRESFDQVVMACHSDQALRLLSAPSPEERRLLSAIPYQSNRVLLHRDPRLMPQQRRVWSSWNYLTAGDDSGEQAASVTYWMNSLQRLDTRHPYFVSLNPLCEPRDELKLTEYEYHHPVFSPDALRAQGELHRIQGRDRIWFAGAWTGYGFHEDGLRSAVEVAQALGASVPWPAQVSQSRALNPLPQLVGQAA